MSDELLPQDADEALEQVPEQTEELASEVTEQVADAEEAVADAAEAVDVAENVAEVESEEAEAPLESEELDERVKAAVRHVAEEAEAEEKPRKKRERRSKQARAAKATASEEAAAPVAPKPSLSDRLSQLGGTTWLLIAACCLALGLLVGRFTLGGSAGSAALSGVTTIEESQLDDVFATYTYKGKTDTVTIRDCIEMSGQADSFKNSDGSYKLPSAELAMSAARNAIVEKEMDARGITATDEDMAAYAEEVLGMSDYDAIAEANGITVDEVKKHLTSACRLKTLREEVIDVEVPDQVTAPEPPEEGKEDEPTKEYADYILGLAGDEWNSKKGKWADKSSEYATALADYDISEDGATYEAASAAYYVAYQKYNLASQEYNNQWTSFINDLMSNASIEVGTLVM